jgi:hypothetical protein
MSVRNRPGKFQNRPRQVGKRPTAVTKETRHRPSVYDRRYHGFFALSFCMEIQISKQTPASRQETHRSYKRDSSQTKCLRPSLPHCAWEIQISKETPASTKETLHRPRIFCSVFRDPLLINETFSRAKPTRVRATREHSRARARGSGFALSEAAGSLRATRAHTCAPSATFWAGPV